MGYKYFLGEIYCNQENSYIDSYHDNHGNCGLSWVLVNKRKDVMK